MTGQSFEEVLFLRDEQANMAWAIEQFVQGRSGDRRDRAGEPQPEPDPWPDGLDPNERVYRLQSRVPAHWIPLVPVALRAGQVSLRKGALLRDGVPLLPAGVTLAPTPLTFPGEEIPRDGVRVRAVPVLARRADGTICEMGVISRAIRAAERRQAALRGTPPSRSPTCAGPHLSRSVQKYVSMYRSGSAQVLSALHHGQVSVMDGPAAAPAS